MTTNNARTLSPTVKSLLDFLPLVAFFIAYLLKGMLWATGALLVATLIVTAVFYALTGKLSKQQIVTAVLVGFFGVLTLYFQDPAFIKLKVSVINALFGSVLLGGLWFNRLFLSDLLGESIDMPQSAWRTLSYRWAGFFFAMAILNLVVWQQFSDATWVSFKTFGMLGLTFVFAAANAPYMLRHMIAKPDAPSTDG
jgi:intracellular septation protein